MSSNILTATSSCVPRTANTAAPRTFLFVSPHNSFFKLLTSITFTTHPRRGFQLVPLQSQRLIGFSHGGHCSPNPNSVGHWHFRTPVHTCLSCGSSIASPLVLSTGRHGRSCVDLCGRVLSPSLPNYMRKSFRYHFLKFHSIL